MALIRPSPEAGMCLGNALAPIDLAKLEIVFIGCTPKNNQKEELITLEKNIGEIIPKRT